MQCLFAETVDKQAGDVPSAPSYEIQEIKADMRWNRNRAPLLVSGEGLRYMSLSSLEKNLNRGLQDLRERFDREPIKHLIDGEWSKLE